MLQVYSYTGSEVVFARSLTNIRGGSSHVYLTPVGIGHVSKQTKFQQINIWLVFREDIEQFSL